LEPEPTLPPTDWNEARCDVVIAKYREVCKVMPTSATLDLIRATTIDMWQWEDYEVPHGLYRDDVCTRSYIILLY